MSERNDPLVLGITGASGAIYAVRLLQVLLRAGRDVQLAISDSGQAVLQQELDLAVELEPARFEASQLLRPRSAASAGGQLLHAVCGSESQFEFDLGKGQAGAIHYHHYRDFMAPIASGSFLSGGMVICPCSGTTLAAIAHAQAGNLIQRAAEVQLKERRKLIVVPRETPLSTLQLENMHRLSQAGGVVLPASPGWYHGVRDVRDLVDFVVGRICDQLGIEQALVRRWGS